MALFQKLTTFDGREAFVNIDLITAMEALVTGGTAFTRITFDHGNQISVKESAHHIIGALDTSRLPKTASKSSSSEMRV